MNTIELQQTLPAVFAGRDSIISDVWHQSLTLKRGEAYLVEAASGTGKSSLCSYIYGYRNDYQGIICFDGKNIRTLSVRDWVEIRKCSISMLFQELRLFTELTAWENVQLKNSLTGFKSKKEIKAWFEQFGIADKWDTPAEEALRTPRNDFHRRNCPIDGWPFRVSPLEEGSIEILPVLSLHAPVQKSDRPPCRSGYSLSVPL